LHETISMTAAKRYIALIILAVLTGLLSCGKNDSGGNTESVPVILTTGTWSISYYYEDYTDKTSQMEGFVFTFSSNGVLTARKPGYTSTGTWSYDSEDEKLIISIGTEDPLKSLSDDYLFISHSNTEVKLREQITSKDCYLTFTRN
jgi:hypothetical protein